VTRPPMLRMTVTSPNSISQDLSRIHPRVHTPDDDGFQRRHHLQAGGEPLLRELCVSAVRAWWTVMSVACCWPLMSTVLWVIIAAGITWVAAADMIMMFSPFFQGD
jgi:hypothetical protein